MLLYKICFKCKNNLPLDSFYKHAQMKDGYLNKCIACARKDSIVHRDQNLETVRSYDRTRGKLEHRKKLNTSRNSKIRRQFPLYRKAHNMVAYAIKTGRLLRQNCSVCGSEKSLAHHDDYEKPLEVIWLCQIHHKERHKIVNVIRK